uniref:Uncharacterized protein n=1 Tax=Reticulomyxa filosa TaxID=46433 RepID=X6ME31_RETFI|nr:hypothetical protein RFI_25211 [Reticulomyxa filosa]|eukprot:ETO12164.1 hypothetical protein RFI_25211 [Reticulomyxa filosa]
MLYLLLCPIGFGFCTQKNGKSTVIVALAGTPLYYLSLEGMYLLLIARLWYTFEDSPHLKLTRKHLFWLLLPVPIYAVLYVILEDKLDPTRANPTSIILIVIMTSMYVSSCMYLLSLFVRKLSYLIWRQCSVPSVDPQNSAMELSEQQIVLVQVMAKYTILACIGLLSTCITVIGVALCLQIKPRSFRIEYVLFVFFAIDSIVNMFCLFLSFSFADATYRSIFMCLHSRVLQKFQVRLQRHSFVSSKI